MRKYKRTINFGVLNAFFARMEDILAADIHPHKSMSFDPISDYLHTDSTFCKDYATGKRKPHSQESYEK